MVEPDEDTTREQQHERTLQSTLGGGTRLTTDESILSAYVSTNAELFPRVLSLHVPEGSRVADVTYGKGTFWNQVPSDRFDLKASDIAPEKSPCGESIDFRDLPYENNSFDALVLDPPYSSGLYRPVQKQGQGSHESFREAYHSPQADGGGYDLHPQAEGARKRHARVLDRYYRGGDEAKRVLRDGGTFIVKVQDEKSDWVNYMTHIQVTNYYESIGFGTEDLFVLVRPNTPNQRNENQHTALKNHSYFMVYEA